MVVGLTEQLQVTPSIQRPLVPTTYAIRSHRSDSMQARKAAERSRTRPRVTMAMDVSRANTFQNKTRAQQRFMPTMLTIQFCRLLTHAAPPPLTVTIIVIYSLK